jgi:hypothetical protein
MHTGVQRQFSAWQIQGKQALVHFGVEPLGEMGIPVDRDRSFRFIVTGDSG